MSRRLSVTVGRESRHGIEAPERFSTTGDFAVAFENRGQAVHVHLAPDDALARAVSLPESNHLLDGDGTLEVPVRVDADERVEGGLEVVTAYGAASRSIPVSVGPPDPDPTPVDPAPSTTTERSDGGNALTLRERLDGITAGPGGIPLGLVALTVVAAVAALGAALVVGGTAAVVGVVVLLVGVVAAVGLLVVEG